MLGEILHALTNPATAEDMLATIGKPDILARVKREASVEGVATGAFLAAKFRHILDHAGEDVWLDLLGLMSNSPEPGVAALNAMLSRAFPAPVGPRAARSST